jgi:predicted transcriptional regulator
MSARFNLVLSDELNNAIDKLAEESETNKSEILRKSLQLYLAAKTGKKNDLSVGLVDPETQEMRTEFIGL